MNLLKSILGIGLIAGSIIYFNSCAKDSTKELDSTLSLRTYNPTDNILLDPGTGADGNGCYSLVFPLNVQVGTNVYSVNSQEELDKLMKRNPTTTSRAQILYPYSVKLNATGKIVEINSKEDLDKVLRNCTNTKRDTVRRDTVRPKLDTGRLTCYKFVFPLTVKLNDGTLVTVKSQEELNRLRLATTTRKTYELVFPFDVVLANGNKITIHNQEEWNRLQQSCQNRRTKRGG